MLSPWQRMIRNRSERPPERFIPTTPGPRYEVVVERSWEDRRYVPPPLQPQTTCSYDEMMWRADDELEKWEDFIAEMKQTKKRTD